MWAPNNPTLFSYWWFLFINVCRSLLDGREGDVCDGCFFWYPHEQLTKHVMRNGSTIPQCLECENFVGGILEGINA